MPFDGFSKAERSYLAGQRLGRLATVSPTGIVGNAPVAFFVRSDDTVDLGGQRMGATKKFRNVTAGSRVAFVVDDLAPGPGWHPATWRSGARPRRCPTWSHPRAGSPAT
jgi:pyridoxamine 5'-phosphate oxidase family protein